MAKHKTGRVSCRWLIVMVITAINENGGFVCQEPRRGRGQAVIWVPVTREFENGSSKLLSTQEYDQKQAGWLFCMKLSFGIPVNRVRTRDGVSVSPIRLSNNVLFKDCIGLCAGASFASLCTYSNKKEDLSCSLRLIYCFPTTIILHNRRIS